MFTSTREIDDRSLILIDLCVPALTPPLYRSEAALQLSENITLFDICKIYTRVIRKDGKIYIWCLRDNIYIQTLQGRVQNGTLWHPCFYFPCSRSFAFNPKVAFRVWKKWAKMVESWNVDNLYDKPVCHEIWKALYRITKNNADISNLCCIRRSRSSICRCNINFMTFWPT
jgi:hypothetical protein